MSVPAKVPSSFVPFEPLPESAGQSAESGFRLKVVSKSEPSAAAPPPPPGHSHTPPRAGNPVVTCQREGEKVTGIRIECVCGEVIELACEY